MEKEDSPHVQKLEIKLSERHLKDPNGFQIVMIQEVPAFRNFWYQKGITKFGNHKF